jgi:hypothetical protein
MGYRGLGEEIIKGGRIRRIFPPFVISDSFVFENLSTKKHHIVVLFDFLSREII